MKRRLKKLIIITTTFAGLIISFHILMKAYETTTTKYPSLLQPALAELISSDQAKDIRGQQCLSDEATNVHLLGVYEDSVALYQLWEYTGDNGYETRATLLFGEVCGVAYAPIYGDEITDRIPLAGARSLTVQMLEQKIEDSGGIENFEAELTTTLSEVEGGKPELTSVYVWALNEIGVEIPEDLYIERKIDERAPR